MRTMYYGHAEQEESFSYDDEEDDEESFIEIAIEPTSTTEEYEDDEETIEFQFRISFSSSSVPSFPPLRSSQCSSRTNNLFLPCLSSSSTSSSSSSASNLISSSSTTTSMYSGLGGASQNSNPPVPSNAQKTSVFCINESRGIGDTKGCFYENPQSAFPSFKASQELIQSRKTSGAATAMNGGIMKFFIKFRSVKLQSILSFAKKSQKVTVQQGNNGNNSTGICQRDQKQSSNRIIKNYFGIGDKSRVAAINLDAMIKGIIEGMGVSIGRRKDRIPKRKGGPSSIKSSPIHQGSVLNEESKIYTMDNSIQAAISHCKKSFGPVPDSCAQGDSS